MSKCSGVHTVLSFFSSAEPPPDVRVIKSNHSVTISWSKAEIALKQSAYVVEWYPKGQKLEELTWERLSSNDNHIVITGMRSYSKYKCNMTKKKETSNMQPFTTDFSFF